jgi:hypothetical protein
MKFSLKPHQLLAEWLPGFAVLAILFLDHLYNAPGFSQPVLDALPKSEALGALVAVLCLGAVPFALGQILDAARNVLEWLPGLFKKPLPDLAEKWEIKWEKIMELDAEALHTWDDYWFSYYRFDANMAVGLTVILILNCFSVVHFARGWWIGFAVTTLVLAVDAFGLRCEIKGILDRARRHHRSVAASAQSRGDDAADEDQAG